MRSLEARTSLSTALSTELAGDCGTAVGGLGASRQLEDDPSGPGCPRGHHSPLRDVGLQGIRGCPTPPPAGGDSTYL